MAVFSAQSQTAWRMVKVKRYRMDYKIVRSNVGWQIQRVSTITAAAHSSIAVDSAAPQFSAAWTIFGWRRDSEAVRSSNHTVGTAFRDVPDPLHRCPLLTTSEITMTNQRKFWIFKWRSDETECETSDSEETVIGLGSIIYQMMTSNVLLYQVQIHLTVIISEHCKCGSPPTRLLGLLSR